MLQKKKKKKKRKETPILILRLSAELPAMYRLQHFLTIACLPIRTCHSYNVGLNGGAPRYRVSTSASYGVDGLGDAGVRALSLARSGVTVTRLLGDPLPHKITSGRKYRFSFQYKMYQAFSQIFPRAVLRIGLLIQY
jgi:hypothetical protein